MDEEKKNKTILWVMLGVMVTLVLLCNKEEDFEPTPSDHFVTDTVVKEKPSYIPNADIEPEPVDTAPLVVPVAAPAPRKEVVHINTITPVYRGRGVGHRIIGHLRPGAIVTLNNGGKQLFATSTWLPVEVDGREGYIHVKRR